jgi:hypothetical protein
MWRLSAYVVSIIAAARERARQVVASVIYDARESRPSGL